jgi:hypothetical protein
MWLHHPRVLVCPVESTFCPSSAETRTAVKSGSNRSGQAWVLPGAPGHGKVGLLSKGKPSKCGYSIHIRWVRRAPQGEHCDLQARPLDRKI